MRIAVPVILCSAVNAFNGTDLHIGAVGYDLRPISFAKRAGVFTRGEQRVERDRPIDLRIGRESIAVLLPVDFSHIAALGASLGATSVKGRLRPRLRRAPEKQRAGQ